jgi:hypothetical protein
MLNGLFLFIDEVKFGEVALAPPTISKKPRGAAVLETRVSLAVHEVSHIC